MVDNRLTEDCKRDLMRVAYEYAIQYSTDPRTQNGAILVDEYGYVQAGGANHFPVGVSENAERWTQPAKYFWVEHAERNAIYDAARRGMPTERLIMICPWFSCADCARAIIQAGIRYIIGHNVNELIPEGFELTNSTWSESIACAMSMFNESGVRYEYLNGRIDPSGYLAIKRNGKYIHV